MTERIPPHGEQHPEQYREDFYPQAGRDENVQPAERSRHEYPSAYEVKDVHDQLRDFRDEDLRRIPLVPAGTRLRQGATYLDLGAHRSAEFTAVAGTVAREDDRFVPKDDVDHELWNRLLGRQDRPPLSNS